MWELQLCSLIDMANFLTVRRVVVGCCRFELVLGQVMRRWVRRVARIVEMINANKFGWNS
jgi:hypothetical protein